MGRKSESRRGSDMPALQQHFLWHDRLPIGHITVVAGAPAKGKSTLGYRVAADADVPTLFITVEEQDTTVWRPRIEAAGMDLKKAFHHGEIKFSRKPEDIEYLAELIDRYKVELVVVDPLSNHLRGASISRDEHVRDVFEPYLQLIQERRVSLVLQLHVLRHVNLREHPLKAIPAGVVSIAKAVYIFADDPTLGADPDMRILACADKFNFGVVPASMRFEYDTKPVTVKDKQTGRKRRQPQGLWVYRGESQVSAKMLLVTLAPETKERKSDRVAMELIKVLRGGPQPVTAIRKHMAALDPPVSWRTVERIKNEMAIEETDHPDDKRRKIWALPPDILDTLTEADSDDDIQIEEVDKPDDTFPEGWTEEGDDGQSKP